MKTIVDRVAQFIEEWAQDQASTMLVKNFGFVELVNRISKGTTKNRQNLASISTQPIPITIPGDGSEGLQVSLNDEFNFIFWIRTTGRIRLTQDPDDFWGLKQGRRQNLGLRIVIAHKNTFGEDLVYNLAQDLPENININGFEFVFIDSIGEVEDDHETIHDTELGKTNYEKHRFTWNIYALNLNIQFIPCTGFDASSIDIDDELVCITDELSVQITDEVGECLTP
jgi:hypothetical protein